MSFVLAPRHRAQHEESEVSITHRLKGLFNMPARKTDKITKPKGSRPASLTPADVEERLSQSELRKSSFCEEVPVSPARFSIRTEFRDLRRISVERTLFPVKSEARISEWSLEDASFKETGYQACQQALSMPEIVESILLQLETSFSLSVTTTKNDRPESVKSSEGRGPLFSCLSVNSTFYHAARRVISKRVSLHDLEQVEAYTQSSACQDDLCRDLLIHRVKTCEQEQLDKIQQFRLRSLELYVCPKLIPSPAMLSSGTLLKIALPGCALVDDSLMMLVAKMCKKLQILDLRACELVSDAGMLAIADSCPDLSYLNVGRIKRSEAITDASIVEICKKTSVETLGLAGCMIGDESVLAVARHRGSQIERLSMNQCHRITDYAICELLRSAPRLQVLEVVGCDKLQDAKTMCFFKLSTGALVETSEVFAAEIQLYEREVKYELERLKLRASSAKTAQRRVTA